MEIPTGRPANHQAPPILRLPPHLRRRIYLHTDLAPAGLRPRTYGYLHQRPWPEQQKWDAFDLHPRNSNMPLCDSRSRYRGFSGLLRSCRTIYSEVSTLLYSSNDFFIRYWDQRSLEPLRKLPSRSLSEIRRLKIILNETSCPTGFGGELEWRTATWHHEACRLSAAYGGRRLSFSLMKSDPPEVDSEGGIQDCDRPLKSGQPLAETALAEWYATINHLSSCIAPGTLELCLVCDVDPQDIEIARRIVEPLASLPLLRNCHLRLSRVPTTTLNDLARSIVLRVCGISDAQVPTPPQLDHEQGSTSSRPLGQGSETTTASRLLALPQELRFRILEFTDLITPWKEVTWSRRNRGFIASRGRCYPLEGRGEECPPHVHHGCQFVDCWDTYPGPSLGCFCRVKHSAFSSGCKCWEPPQNLFLVCRALCGDAEIIFYTGNRFVIHDMDSHPACEVPAEVQLYPFPRLAASIFLTEVVPEHCLRELRFIELVFPPYPPEVWPQEGQAALEDWARTIEWLSNRLTLPALTIRLCTVEPTLDGPELELFTKMTRGQGEEILAAYERILAPLVHLGSHGLARFYARLDWPWKYTDEMGEACMTYGWEWVAAKDRIPKAHAEKLIMGDRYDSLLEGEGEPPDSLWVRRWARDC
jgi:hypothetical protein